MIIELLCGIHMLVLFTMLVFFSSNASGTCCKQNLEAFRHSNTFQYRNSVAIHVRYIFSEIIFVGSTSHG